MAELEDVVTTPARRQAYLAAGLWDDATLAGQVADHAMTAPGDVAVFRARGNISIVMRLIPSTLLTFDQLGLPKGNLDSGAVWGSYFGLVMLGGAFVAIGVFASSVTDNQIVSLILTVLVCGLFYLLGAGSITYWAQALPAELDRLYAVPSAGPGTAA